MNTILIFHKLVYGRRRSCKSEQYATAAYYSVRKCKVCLREGSSTHPSCTPGTNIEVMISASGTPGVHM